MPRMTGGEAIVDTRLPISRGIAGYVARTCQALIIEQVAGDPRFARDIAERVGYVPDSILATPIVDGRGDVMGVLSVLDRGRHTGDTLALASAFADQASFLLPHIDLTVRLAPVLFAALADAIDHSDHDLAGALRRQAQNNFVFVRRLNDWRRRRHGSGWDDRWRGFSRHRFQQCHRGLLSIV